MSLAGLLDGPARWAADRPALLEGERPLRTWAELAEAVARRAGGLRERHGIEPGDAVALFASNHAAYLELLFAIWHAGAVAVPISSRLHAREAADIVERSHARLVLGDPRGRRRSSPPLLDGPATIVLGDEDDEALLAAEPAPLQPRALTDDAWIFFTSGHHRPRPRARGSAHGNLAAMAFAFMADGAELTPRDSIVHVAALSHASGPDGAALRRPRRRPGAAGVGRLRRRRAVRRSSPRGERSSFFVPPTLLRRLAAHPRRRLGGPGAARHDPGRRGARAPLGPARRGRGIRAVPVERLRPGRVAVHDHRQRQAGRGRGGRQRTTRTPFAP